MLVVAFVSLELAVEVGNEKPSSGFSITISRVLKTSLPKRPVIFPHAREISSPIASNPFRKVRLIPDSARPSAARGRVDGSGDHTLM